MHSSSFRSSYILSSSIITSLAKSTFGSSRHPQLRSLHSTCASLIARPRTLSNKSKRVMTGSSSHSKSTRKRGEPSDTSDTSPPAKKPMFSIFEKKSSKPLEPADIRWETHGTSFIVGEAFNPKAGSKVAAFDLDQTLIKVNGKHKWPKNADDWVWWAAGVPAHLKEVADTGYTIVIITNQGGLDGNVAKQDEMRSKFEKISAQLRLPMWILISMQKDHYRKPMTGLWHWLEAKFHESNIEIDRADSYYVGDAAGRHDGWKVGAVKDFNNTDRKFAASLDLPFHTPEHFFLNQPCPDDKWSYGSFDPKTLPKNVPLFSPTSSPLLPSPATSEVIVFCGYPAAGKSTFAHRHILPTGQYDYVNQDTLKTKDKCIKAVEESLKNKRAVVVDNTNPDVATRASYIALAKKHNVPVRCFLFIANKDLAAHNNYFRAFHRPLTEVANKASFKEALSTTATMPNSTATKSKTTLKSTSTTTEKHVANEGSSSTSVSIFQTALTATKVRDEPPRERLSEMVFASYAKKYQEPTLKEGFSEIKKINFVPDEDIRSTWERWYL